MILSVTVVNAIHNVSMKHIPIYLGQDQYSQAKAARTKDDNIST